MEVTTKADNVLDVMEEKAETRDEVPVTVVTARYEGEEPLPNYTVFNFLGNKTWFFIKIFLLLFVIGYTIAVLLLDFRRGVPVLYIEIFFVSVFIIGLFFRKFEKSLQKIAKYSKSMSWQVSLGINFGILLICIVVAVVLSSDDYTRLFALLGLFAIVFLCYLFSWNRRKVSWRPVLWGFYLQFVFAVFILRTQAGETMFLFFGGQVQALLDYTKAGTSFVFGNALLELGGGPFALTVLPVIIFFSGITSVLFYWGVLQRFTLAIGNVMMFTLGTSAPESLSAAGNIFLGQTEAPLLIRPYLKFMTNSEIHAVMTGGFGTIAGGVLAAFISFGVPAEHLLAASVMSAPASLAISKLVYPETMKVDDSAIDKLDIGEHPTNALEAFTRGATISIGLLANIVVNLIAFLALIEFLNTVFAYFLTKLGNDKDNFTTIVGKIMSPFALLMGIPIEDMQLAGELLGNKIVANEFVAFLGLVGENGPDPKSKTFLILTYALCGFSNFSSIGIQLGALGIMAPNKLTAMSKMALSAMLCGNIACFMTACIAGVLLKNE